ncbi:DUF5677 domain-containing protein [Sphingobium sufflavum]|uniref:DUF5677 domain-containing protein n=1 Tax=Sphingobium sufflavum TaxID=1129547 RepID=UPI001F1B5C16|nr:DUF5677 domain-containing protein [Sphingobium sufflavum]MCE7798198.1 DUF5677 domain-containing protein [Sphingobium sufflavum]
MIDDDPLIVLDRLNELVPTQLTRVYLRYRQEFRNIINRGKKVSRGSAGIFVNENRLSYASLLFTKIIVNALTIEKLLPDCRPKEHWDFSSVASLTRNLAEAYLWYYWLCQDEVDPDVRQGRFILLYCHDHGSRARIFPAEAAEYDQAEVMADLTARFDGNAYLRTFDPRQRREALKGHKTPFIQDEVLERMGADKEAFRLGYRFFSQHTHTGPMSFFRMIEHDRGAGVETVLEKAYTIIATIHAAAILDSAIEGHLSLFQDAETRTPPLTDADVIRNVERNQGRARVRGT